MDTTCTLNFSVKKSTLAKGGLNQTKAVIIVAIAGIIPVAISRTQPIGFIVPRAAAQNALV